MDPKAAVQRQRHLKLISIGHWMPLFKQPWVQHCHGAQLIRCWAQMAGGDKRAWTKFTLPAYVKVSLPHAALVIICTLYVILGAFVFHAVEAPNEIQVKTSNAIKIRQVTLEYLDMIWTNRRKALRDSSNAWRDRLQQGLRNVTELLYQAYTTEYVDHTTMDLAEMDGLNKLAENHWSVKSAIFFATTTMVTVGYGNIVPITAQGRLLCIFYALFGCPLAIITLADLGKFISELVVHWYNIGQRCKYHMKRKFCHVMRRRLSQNGNELKILSYDDVFLDGEGISALLVFTIFLFYVAAGSVLFSLMENWTFIDAFYFCFISVTTVGLGDFVPANDPGYLFVICYTAIGIGITTMCIDLVGTRYIMKIHYFGRKLRGADLVRYLLRKKIREKRIQLAARAAEVIDAYMNAINKNGSLDNTVAQKDIHLPLERSDLATDNILTTPLNNSPTSCIFYEDYVKNQYWQTSSSHVAHKGSHHLPSISSGSSEKRRQMYEKPSWSVTSSTEPSMDVFSSSSTDSNQSSGRAQFVLMRGYAMQKLTEECKSSSIKSSPIIGEHSADTRLVTNRPWGSCRPFIQYSSASDSSAIDDGSVDESKESIVERDLSPADTCPMEEPPVSSEIENLSSIIIDPEMSDIESGSESSIGCQSMSQASETDQPIAGKFSMPEWNSPSEWPQRIGENLTFLLQTKFTKNGPTLKPDSNWTCHIHPAKYYFSQDLKQFERVNVIFAKQRLLSARLSISEKRRRDVSIPIRPTAANRQARSRRKSLFRPGQQEHGNGELDIHHVYKMTRIYSFWKTCTSFHCICTKIEPCAPNSRQAESYVLIQYVWRNAKQADKRMVEEQVKRCNMSYIPGFLHYK